MTKRLCKLSRVEIAEQLNDIHRLVVQPRFVCHSCARSAQDSERLCKPVEIPRFIESITPLTSTALSSSSEAAPHEKVRLDQVIQQTTMSVVIDIGDREGFKKAQKAAKKREEQLKEMEKVLKKQRKLAKKHLKLQQKLALPVNPNVNDDASSPRSLH